MVDDEESLVRGVTYSYKAELGDVAPTIIDTATNERIDLLVMNTHGRSGLRRWVYGNVANRVLRGITCPLLLIHHAAPTADLV
ncbi:MAG: universal stress protein [Caldilineaceae bacterium]